MKKHIFLLLGFCLIFGASFAQDKAVDPPRHIVDIKRIVLNIQADEKTGVVKGTATYIFTPLFDDIKEFVLDAEEMTIEKISLGKKSLAFERKGGKLTIDLKRAYSKKDTLEINIEYSALPRKGIYFISPDEGYPQKPFQIWTQGEPEDSHYWFPCFDFPNERATSEILVSVRKPFIAISNGALIGVEDAKEAGWRTFHWREDTPHPAYLISLVIGEFEELKAEYDGVPLYYYVQKQDVKNAMLAFQKTPQMMRFFAKSIGVKYPYKKYAQTPVEDFMWGGMENISATTLNQSAMHDERAHLYENSDGLVAHELAHQWWGNLLTCRDWSHLWLNEGFATYFEKLWTEHDRGVDEFNYSLRGSAGWAIGSHNQNPRPVVHNRYDDPYELFDGHSYAKGAWVLHMFRGLLGERDFWRGIHLYATRHKNSSVTTNDLRLAMEDASGKNLEWFFDRWLYQKGHPKFTVRWEWDEENNFTVLYVKQTQNEEIFKIPMDVEITTSNSAKTYRITLEGREQNIYIPTAEKPLMVRFDKFFKILKELDFEKSEDELLYQLKNDGDSIGRMEAAESLVKYPSPRAISALSTALKEDPFYGVRIEIANLLGSIDAEEAKNALLLASRDKDARVRSAVASALGKFRDDAVVARLKELFESDLSYQAQAEAVFSLAKIKPENVLDILQSALEKPSHKEVIRRKAFEGLAELKDKKEEIAPILLGWTAYGKPSWCRTAAISAYVKFSKEKPEETARFLLPFLKDKNFWVRITAIDSLKDLNQPLAVPHLIELAESDPIDKARESAKRAVKALQNSLKN